MRHVVPWQVFPGRAHRPTIVGEERGWELRVAPLLSAARAYAGSQLRRTGLVLAVLAMCLGLLLIAQLQTGPTRAPATAESRREITLQTIRQLEQEQADLKKVIAERRARVAALQQASASERSSLSEINNELERQKVLAGMVPLRGRGLKAVLDDSAIAKIPPGDDPSFYIIHEYQLRDVLNALWLGGAEAVSLNGERVVATTSIYCVGSTILVNDTRLSPPYEFSAIGDPAALEGALNSPASLQALKARVKAYGLQFTVARASQVDLPAYSGSLDVKYSAPGTASADQPGG